MTHINPAPTDDDSLNTVLHTLVTQAQNELGDNFIGAYLRGSSALGTRDRWSDVDFVVVIEHDFNEATMQRIQTIHRDLYDTGQFWAQHLEGSYIPRDIIKQPQDDPEPVWYIDHGSRDFERSTHDNDCIVRWVTRERGITLAGPPPATLIDPVSADTLRQEVHGMMKTYDEARAVERGDRDFESLWEQSFIILAYARMLHTLATGEVHSKPAAVQWVQDTLDERWHSLLRQAAANRKAFAETWFQPPDPALTEPARAFIRYTIEKSDEHIETG